MSTQPIPLSQFAQGVRDKYPGAYDHLGDTELVGKIIEKYPQYKDNIQGMAKTDFEKQRTEGERGFWPAVKRALPGLFSSPDQSTAEKAGVSMASSAFNNEPETPTKEAPFSVGSLVGMDPQAAAKKAEHADPWGIVGQATVPAATAIGSAIAAPLGRGMKSGIAKALRTPEGEIRPEVYDPKKLVKTIAEKVVPDRPAPPKYPGAALPSTEEFYENKGEDLARRGRQQETLDRKAAREAKANAPGPELGSPENPGFHAKLPTRMPKPEPAPEPSPFAGATSSADSVGPMINPFPPAEPTPFPRVGAAPKPVPEEESLGTRILPEPRQPLPGDKPGAMWTIPRAELPSAAQRGAPGAGDVMRNLNEPIVYLPREGVGYGPLREFEDVAPQESVGPKIGPTAPETVGLKPGGLMSDIPQPPPSAQELEDISRELGRPITAAEYPELRRRMDAERNISEGLRGNRKDTAGEIREKHRAKLEKKGTR